MHSGCCWRITWNVVRLFTPELLCRYKKRNISVEMTFDLPEGVAASTTPATTGAGSPAVVSRKGSATYEDSPKYSLDRGQSLDQILGGGDDSVRYEDGDGDGDGDGAGRVYSGKI